MKELNKVKELVKDSEFMAMRKELEKEYKKNKIDFSFSPVPHYSVKLDNNKTIIITNKDHVELSENTLVVGKFAIDYN